MVLKCLDSLCLRIKKRDASMLIFLIPAYNEERNIKALLLNTMSFAEKAGYQYKIVIVNDGSTDSTLEILKLLAKKMPLIILDQEVNKGVGEAFKRGFTYLASESKDDDIIITKEADNTSDLSVLMHMIEKINEGYDLALASCYMRGGGVVGTIFYRRLLSWGANLIIKTVTPLKHINTFSSFYRAHKATLVKAVYDAYGDSFIQEKGFVCMVEMLINMSKLNIKICEVPMVLKGNLRQGKSKMKTMPTIKAYMRLILRNLFSSKRCCIKK